MDRRFGDEIDRRAQAFMEVNECDYHTAYRAVLDGNPRLKAAYAQAPVKTAKKPPPSGLKPTREVSEEVHGLVTEYLTQHGNVCSYSQALHEVLKDNPELAKEYAL
jgi:hypothetical protein